MANLTAAGAEGMGSVKAVEEVGHLIVIEFRGWAAGAAPTHMVWRKSGVAMIFTKAGYRAASGSQ